MVLFWKQLLQSITMGLILPGILFSTAEQMPQDTPLQEPPSVQPQVWIPVVKEDGRVEAMELEAYVSRVVLGEMPASFDEEALKAQAVAARTYTLRTVELGDRHAGAVCTDYACCQEYRDPESYLENGGSQESIDKVFSAVAQTAGEVLCYDGELICATYFASAGGQTEDAQEVWGEPYPYLLSVPSPEKSKYDGDCAFFSFEEFCQLLEDEPEGDPESWFGTVTYTVGGGVGTMRIGDTRYSGVELRQILGLRSTIFTVEVEEEGIGFRTQGFGHRVGLSQYGADALAAEGLSYQQILSHYYTDTTLSAYGGD